MEKNTIVTLSNTTTKVYTVHTSSGSIAQMLSPIKPILTEVEEDLLEPPVSNESVPVPILDINLNSVLQNKNSPTNYGLDALSAKQNIDLLSDSGFTNKKIVSKVGANSKKTYQTLFQPHCNIHEFNTTYKLLDTHALARKVKDILIENNIGQRIFGQAVLGLTQGSVSDLLSHPKSWQCLSLKGREPFIKMHLWLENPQNIQLLKNLKTEKLLESTLGTNRCSISSSVYTTYRNTSGTKKKRRVVLSNEEKLVLLQAYGTEPYPSHDTVELLATKLNKKSSTIVNWFHNYRSRVKRGFFSFEDLSKSDYNGKSEIAPSFLLKAPTRNGCVLDEPISNNLSIQEKNMAPSLFPSPCPSVENNELILTKELPNVRTNPVVITATVLLTDSSHTVTPIISFSDSSKPKLLTDCKSESLNQLLQDLCQDASVTFPVVPAINSVSANDSLPPASSLLKSYGKNTLKKEN